MKTLHLYRTRTGYRWRYVAANGRIRCAATEFYDHRRDMVACARDAFPDFCDGHKTFTRDNARGQRETIRVVDTTHLPVRKETR